MFKIGDEEIVYDPNPVLEPEHCHYEKPFLRIGLRACCWPIGDPKAFDFRFCGKLAVEKHPYCEEHVKQAYHRHVIMEKLKARNPRTFAEIFGRAGSRHMG